MKKSYVTDKAPQPVGPYSQVVAAGDFLFLAGQIPLTPQGTMLQGDVEKQTRQVLNNLKAVLKEAGVTMNHVVKTTIFLANLSDFERVNRVYAEYFEQPFPARSTVEASKLPKGATIEIDAIAHK